VFASGRRYQYLGRRKTLTWSIGLGKAEMIIVDALEFEPHLPAHPHVYLLIPIYPDIRSDVTGALERAVPALADAFDLCSHIEDWPDKAPGCGIVVAPVDPERGWSTVWPEATPGIEVSVRWLRGKDLHEVGYRGGRYECTAEDVAKALGTKIPVWPAGSNEAGVVAAWEPGDPPLVCPIPAHRADSWLLSQYGASMVKSRPGRGYAELATMLHQQIADDSAQLNEALDLPPDGPWTPAVRFEPPALYPLPDERVSMVDAAHDALGSPDTPVGVGRAILRVLRDPMRGWPVVVPNDAVPADILRVVDAAPACRSTTPRTRHLLECAAKQSGVDGWELRVDRRATTDYLYATTPTQLAWLPVGGWLDASQSRGLLPVDPAEVHLVRDAHGTLGGWVTSVDGTATPLPRVDGHDIEHIIAAIITGRPIQIHAPQGRLGRTLGRIAAGTNVTYQWRFLASMAADLPVGEPKPHLLLPFQTDDEAGIDITIKQRVAPAIIQPDRWLPFDEHSAVEFEKLISNLIGTADDIISADLNEGPGPKQDGVDVLARLAHPADPRRPWVAIQCKNTKRLKPSVIADSVTAFLQGWAATSFPDRGSIKIFFQKVRNLCLRNVGAIPRNTALRP
jgi:hypothetical protein